MPRIILCNCNVRKPVLELTNLLRPLLVAAMECHLCATSSSPMPAYVPCDEAFLTLPMANTPCHPDNLHTAKFGALRFTRPVAHVYDKSHFTELSRIASARNWWKHM